MKKFLFYFMISILFSCSTDTNENNSNVFETQLAPSSSNVTIDEAFTLNVSAVENISQMWVSLDNFATGGYSIRYFGTSYNLYFNFDEIGQKIIYVRSKNSKNQVSEKQVIINVTRGNALKIKGMQVVSFYNINQTWDPEYSTTDINRLADVFFGFNKSKLGSFLDNEYFSSIWYTSSVKQNQGDLTWNLSNANLYISPNRGLRFGLVDSDSPPLGEDLLNGPPDYRDLSFSSFIATKPTVLSYTFPEINLEIKLNVEWAN
jgi:hypothetical protein